MKLNLDKETRKLRKRMKEKFGIKDNWKGLIKKYLKNPKKYN